MYIFIAKGTCYWSETEIHDEGILGPTGKLLGLILSCRHGYGISYFQYRRSMQGSMKIRYMYECCTSQLPCISRNVKNPKTNYGLGSPSYLDRQHVNCTKGIITTFQLVRYVFKQAYEYSCCQVTNRPVTCYTNYTNYEDSGAFILFAGHIKYLEKHKVQCQPKYLLSGFQLEAIYGSERKWRYRYSCCNTQF